MCPGAAGAASRTGVNCSVRPVPPRFRQNAARRADFAVEMPRAAPARRARASRRARSLTTAPGSCGIRAAGVPGRGENGKTCRCVSPHSSTRSSERRNIASVSVGKPAIRSAPNTISGRSRRTCVAERDRIGAQMPPLHALEDEIVAGLQRQMQMRHQPLVAARRHRADRGRPRPNRSRTAAAA